MDWASDIGSKYTFSKLLMKDSPSSVPTIKNVELSTILKVYETDNKISITLILKKDLQHFKIPIL